MTKVQTFHPKNKHSLLIHVLCTGHESSVSYRRRCHLGVTFSSWGIVGWPVGTSRGGPEPLRRVGSFRFKYVHPLKRVGVRLFVLLTKSNLFIWVCNEVSSTRFLLPIKVKDRHITALKGWSSYRKEKDLLIEVLLKIILKRINYPYVTR